MTTETIAAHWKYREAMEDKSLIQYCRFAVLETLVILYLLMHHAQDADTIEDLLKSQNIPFSRVDDSFGSSKKRHSENILGWKLHGEGIHSINDIQILLSHLFLEHLLVVKIKKFVPEQYKEKEKKREEEQTEREDHHHHHHHRHRHHYRHDKKRKRDESPSKRTKKEKKHRRDS